MLFHSLYGGPVGIYVQQMTVLLDHPLDADLFLRAWTELVARHDVFRTSFHWDVEGEMVQSVHRSADLPVHCEDWQALGEAEQQRQLESYLNLDKSHGFNLAEPPLMRLALFRLGKDRHQLIWTYHHALLDGRSRVLIYKELFAIYEALLRREPIELDCPRPYEEYVSWLKSLDLSRAERFWRDLLDGFVSPTPLPGAKPFAQGSAISMHAERLIRIPESLTSCLHRIAKESAVTLNTMLQGAWALVLGAYSGQLDVIFGTTRACRHSSLPGVERMVGLFINTLPVRVRIKPEARMLGWLQELRALHIAMRDYEHTPLVAISGWTRISGEASLFDSFVVFENYSFDTLMKAQGGEWEKRTFQLLQRSNFPIALSGYLDGDLIIRLEYDQSRFEESLIARISNDLATAFEAMAENPRRCLGDFELISSAEKHQLIVEYNDTAAEAPDQILVHELFEQQARVSPDAVALIFRDESLSYRQLNHAANRLAHYLIKAGAGPDSVVCVCLPRSLELVIGLLAVLKASSAYLPLDPSYPDHRLDYLLEDSGATLLLTKRARAPLDGMKQIDLDGHAEKIGRESVNDPLPRATQENLAYVIYTSGSTGSPKGTMIPHRCLANLLMGLKQSVYAEGPQRRLRISLNGPIAFDTSIKQLIQLASGHTLEIVPQEVREDPDALMDFISSGAVDVIDFTPSLFQMIIACGLLKRQSLPAMILLGGEAIDEDLWRLLASAETTFYNLYGPTETTVDATASLINRSSSSPALGRPLANVAVYVLNENLGPAERGARGELFIAGAGVGRGYSARAMQTAESFLPDPYTATKGERMYRTGDLCRYREDGSIEYLGRRDAQVKIRGYRVEPAEVEAALRRQKGISHAAVVAKEGPSGKRLVAYIVADEGVSGGQVRQALRQELPDYLTPQAIVPLGELPLTANGKLDRQRLMQMSEADHEPAAGFPERPATTAEEIIAGIWQDVLKKESVGLTENFFDLGGHSLLAMQVIVRVRRAFSVDMGFRSLFETPTIESFARAVEQAQGSGTRPDLRIIQKVPRLALTLDGASELGEKLMSERDAPLG